jgi:hypothetical protein
MKKAGVSGGIGCVIFISYLAFVNYLEPYQVGVARNLVSGEVSLQNPLKDRGGFYLTAPWVQVARIDTRPMRVCITSSARAFNCKLVQFEPSAYKEFVAVQGFRYYWWANRISLNFGYTEEYRGVKDLLRGYAFGVKQYPFVTVLRDYVE